MANASRDQNGVPTLIAASSADGVTPIRVLANTTMQNSLKVSNGTTGSNFGRSIAVRDQNSVPVLMAVSSADGVTPIEVYTDSSGNLLIQST